jgi:predicted RNA-binding Zn ribbon-like protein
MQTGESGAPGRRRDQGERPGRWLPVQTGAPWLDLVATVSKAYGPRPLDRLVNPERLADWLASQDLLPQAKPDTADLARARDLREALRGLSLAAVHHHRADPADVAIVNDALALDRPLQLEPGHDLALRPPATTGEALARLARQAVEQFGNETAADLHQCSDAECGMLFLDPSGRRRWCSLEICGVRNRVRAHRERRRMAAATAGKVEGTLASAET